MNYKHNQQKTATNSCSTPDTLADRLAYVEALVDMNALVLEAIWPSTCSSSNIVPLRSFIHQVLKRSRTTYSTLQTAFFYLFRARPAILRQLHAQQHPQLAFIQCGRRMFLASLMVASKFVQDKTYRNAAWANMAGLDVQEINMAERVFLELLGYRLYVAQATFDQWHSLLHTHVYAKSMTSVPTQQQQLFPSSTTTTTTTTTTKKRPLASSSLSPPATPPALSPASLASSSTCSSPNVASPAPRVPSSSSILHPPAGEKTRNSNNKRSLAHLLNSPVPTSQEEPVRKRTCLASSS
ncbi:cyclin-domain-containing protein [Absidia repens]|uniref:Cyclin-domain-containing protein n=1 Tax=Absidia repens TaxID=90262 RepID=A0A1X2I8I6_9FUNG|nr:cyclin-domain-containing protein [Absidia repens]